MTTSYSALCNDFYVNAKLALKMDLPTGRETVLDLFDRVRRQRPSMNKLKRFRGELALESGEREGAYEWLALRRTSVRTGSVNPASMEDAASLHRLALETSPFYLSINPLDVEYLELLLGFDLEAPGNHSAIVYDALYADTPAAKLVSAQETPPVDIQPFFGVSLSPSHDLQAYFEVKARTSAKDAAAASEGPDEPISVYATVRSTEPVADIKDLPARLDRMIAEAEHLAQDRVIPHLVTPLRDAIAASRF
jgi:hypothetical protein